MYTVNIIMSVKEAMRPRKRVFGITSSKAIVNSTAKREYEMKPVQALNNGDCPSWA